MANKYAGLEKFLTKTLNEFISQDCKKRIVAKTKDFILEQCSFSELMEEIQNNFSAWRIPLEDKNLDEYMERVIELKVVWDKWLKELDEQLDKSINWIYHYLES